MKIDEHEIVNKLIELLPPRRSTHKGWETFNCPMCTYNGEPSRDKHKKGAIIFAGPSFTFKCWRCKFKAHFKPGMRVSDAFEQFLNVLGTSDNDIRDLKLKAMTLQQLVTIRNDYEVTKSMHKFKHIELPVGALALTTLEGGDILQDTSFQQVIQYASTLGQQILNADLHYSPATDYNMSKRLIIPFKFNNTIVGYTARYAKIEPAHGIPKYITNSQAHFLFNNQYLDDYDRQYICLVEGPMDALSINGVAYLKDTLTQGQINWIKASGKTPVLVPDRGKSAYAAIEQAIKYGWHVSLPDWDDGIKDVHDSYIVNGALVALENIFDNMTNSEFKIKTRWKSWH